MRAIRSSEITPEHVYVSRRRFIKGAVKLAASAALLSACGQSVDVVPEPTEGEPASATPAASATPDAPSASAVPATEAPATDVPATASPTIDVPDYELTPVETITQYTNYYEFTLAKDRADELAAGFPTDPWTVQVGGLVENPRTFDLDDLRAFEVEERIYRLRCVEAWSMVIPWLGFPLARLLREVQPTSQAQYVRFETAYDEEQMPGLSSRFTWPYVEGLRLDEALHDLTLLATGLYGRDLEPQNGAPIRLVVPWKYGFKSIKAIVKIDLVEEMPKNFWAVNGPSEYGFWANVNPNVPHPRWSQATERLLGENRRVETLFLNGYADEVAELYDDLDSGHWYR
jgi:sulfoxide reductase catalytic subunit YedY